MLFLRSLSRKPRRLFVVGFLFTLAISPIGLVVNIPAVGKNFPQFADYHLPEVTRHAELLQTISDKVPTNAPVLTQNSIFVHFSSRANAYVYPLPWMLQGYFDITQLTTMLEGYNGTELPWILPENRGPEPQFVMTDTTTDSYTANVFGFSGNQTVVRDYGLVAYGNENYTNVGKDTTPSGTSFPQSPELGDLFHRVDENILYRYDGERWVGVIGGIYLYEKNYSGPISIFGS
jgi:hypothetical protein